jgi:site-specific DNA-methyltransferase (adenine-specific)
MELKQGNCLELMKGLGDGSIDLILCDLPYEVTQNPKDKQIPLDQLWKEYKRIIKEDGTIVLTSQFPFTLDLITSNKEMFKYDLIWDKILPSGFLNSNRMPLRTHEHILIFYKKLGTYNPQYTKGKPSHSKGKMTSDKNQNYGDYGKIDNSKKQGDDKFPNSIISFMKPHPSKALHPTQKSLELFEWLIKTYSNEGDKVLDNCMGSGTTGVACKNTRREFIGFELNEEYFRIAEERIKEATKQVSL